MGGPVFFIQTRPGKNEKLFRMYKFRTMKNIYNKGNALLPDIERITKLGMFLRKTSIDELPELLNILKGEMSFVGPRPLLEKYLPYYTEEERIRHKVRPGLTGLSQISGRNYVDWDKRLRIDLDYVSNISFWLDTKIILITIIKSLMLKDVASPSTVVRDLSDVREKI